MLQLRTFGGLRVESQDGSAAAGIRPRSLALLSLLAADGASGMSRDQVLGILWPDYPADRARHALSQTLYSLRRDLRVDVVRATPDLQLDPARISSDVTRFREAVACGDCATVAALYVGPFLEGFYLSDAPEFERWTEARRSDFARHGVRALAAVAAEQQAAGRFEETAESWRRLTRLDPYDARFAIGYMEALAQLGQRAGALAHGKAYTELLQRDLEMEPDADVQQTIARLRGASNLISTSLRSESGDAPPPLERLDAPPPRAAVQPAARSPLRRRVVFASAVFTILLAAIALRASTYLRSDDVPVFAVRIRDLTTPNSPPFGGVLNEMLTTGLGRVPELQVIANSRMLEITQRSRDTGRAAMSDAARRAGATEIIEGELIPLPNERLQLDVRRVDAARGRIRASYRVVGNDALSLLDRVTVLIASDLRLATPAGTLADVSTSSPEAYRLYEEGLRSFHYDPYSAYRQFRAAVHADTMFAMATYRAWRAALVIQSPEAEALALRTLALAARASDHDRLLIRAHVGGAYGDPDAFAAAETLAARYPNDPEALVRAASALGIQPRAIAMLERAVGLDSVAGTAGSAECRICESLEALAGHYNWADSMAATERTLRRWMALRPDDAKPYLALSDHLIGTGRVAEAGDVQRRGESLGGHVGDDVLRRLTSALRVDDLEVTETQCASLLLTHDKSEFQRYRWYCLIALRMAGRYREAKELARAGRVPGTSITRDVPPDAVNDALLDFETGRPLVAATKFDTLPYLVDRSMRASAGWQARSRSWNLARSLTASAAGGDTLRAQLMVDSLEHVGRQSRFGRDSLLHHFIRGLLLARAEQHAAAVREYRAAMFSPTNGYTRVNYELARSLLALGRPAEALPLLRAALHGGIEGSGLYLTRTEAHELIARAFDAAGQRDSAAVHYTVVERNWKRADPVLQPRYVAARDWLARNVQPRSNH